MTVETHPFKQSFESSACTGFVVQYLNAQGIVRQKYNNDNLCLFVFETRDAAEKERNHFPKPEKFEVACVDLGRIKQFLSAAILGPATLVFIRDNAGSFATLKLDGAVH